MKPYEKDEFDSSSEDEAGAAPMEVEEKESQPSTKVKAYEKDEFDSSSDEEEEEGTAEGKTKGKSKTKVDIEVDSKKVKENAAAALAKENEAKERRRAALERASAKAKTFVPMGLEKAANDPEKFLAKSKSATSSFVKPAPLPKTNEDGERVLPQAKKPRTSSSRSETTRKTTPSVVKSRVVEDWTSSEDESPQQGTSIVRKRNRDLFKLKKPVKLRTGGEARGKTIVTTFPQSTTSKASKLEFGLFRHRSERRAHHHIVYSRTSAVELEGRSFGRGNSSKEKLCRYLVFAYDPKANEARLVNTSRDIQFPVEVRNSVRHLPEPNVVLLDPSGKDDADSDADDAEGDDKVKKEEESEYLKRKRLLVENFGSTKVRKSLANAAQNKVTSAAVASGQAVRQVLEATGSEAAETKEAGLMATRKLLLPPFNQDADSPLRVYVINEIIPSVERRSLRKKAEALIEIANVGQTAIQEAQTEKKICEFVAYTLPDLENCTTATEAGSQAVALSYIQVLVQFYHHRGKIGSPKDLSEELGNDASVEVCRGVINQFSAGGRKNKLTTDRLILFTLAVALRLGGCRLHYPHLDALARSFQQPIKWLLDYFKQLGCTSRDENVCEAPEGVSRAAFKQVTLHVPLTFPDNTRRGQKRRG
mmetsp:Transcript_1151/g.1777  ORF Transcript_1151/g.1777 Transcript_1151/m.1777 type:complete len:648 (+) Transcript_1151:142-2085(+)